MYRKVHRMDIGATPIEALKVKLEQHFVDHSPDPYRIGEIQ